MLLPGRTSSHVPTATSMYYGIAESRSAEVGAEHRLFHLCEVLCIPTRDTHDDRTDRTFCKTMLTSASRCRCVTRLRACDLKLLQYYPNWPTESDRQGSLVLFDVVEARASAKAGRGCEKELGETAWRTFATSEMSSICHGNDGCPEALTRCQASKGRIVHL